MQIESRKRTNGEAVGVARVDIRFAANSCRYPPCMQHSRRRICDLAKTLAREYFTIRLVRILRQLRVECDWTQCRDCPFIIAARHLQQLFATESRCKRALCLISDSSVNDF